MARSESIDIKGPKPGKRAKKEDLSADGEDSSRERVEYVADLLKSTYQLAQDLETPFLSYLIEMAVLEADVQREALKKR